MSGFLRDLYSFLRTLAPADSSSFKKDFVKFRDLADVSDILFARLQMQFELLISGAGETVIGASSLDEFSLLLRCCFTMLPLLEFDQSLIHRQCQTLIMVLRKLCRSSFLIHGNKGSSFQEPIVRECSERRVLASFFCIILEVCMDELLLNPQLRKHVAISDFVSDSDEKLFACEGNPGDYGVILELLCCHFLLTDYRKGTFNRFISLLSWGGKTTFEMPMLNLSANLSLFNIVTISSVPYMLQAHLVLLALRSIHTEIPRPSRNSDRVDFDAFVSGFELSNNLYARCVGAINFDNHSSEDDIGFSFFEASSFKSKIQPATGEEVNAVYGKFFGDLFDHVSSEKRILSHDDYVSYIEEYQRVLHATCKEETILVLDFVTYIFLSGKDEAAESDRNDKKMKEGMFYLAALLNLMGSCVLKFIPYLGKKLAPWEKELIWGIIRSFGKYGSYPHVREAFVNATEPDNANQRDVKLMLAHFTSLLLHCIRYRLMFLWESCTFMVITLMNLLSEEGIFDALKPLFSYMKEALIAQSVATKTPQDADRRRSSVEIALRIQGIRTPHQIDGVASSGLDCRGAEFTGSYIGEEKRVHFSELEKNRCLADAGTCNGEGLIKCLSKSGENPSEWDDLVDFITCTPGKNYSSWLKNKERFRRWKAEKVAVVRVQGKAKFRKRLKRVK